MKTLIALKLNKKTEIFEFPSKKQANAFIQEMKRRYKNIEYAIGRETQKGLKHE